MGHPREGASARTASIEGLGYEVTAVATVDDVTELVAATFPDLLLVRFAPGPSAAAVALAESILRQVPTPAVFLGPGSAKAALAHADVTEPYGYVDAAADDEALRLAFEHALGFGMELRASHDLDAFFALSQDMFAFLDFAGHFLRLNPAWERTLGYTPAELMARPFIEYVHPEDRERTLRQNSQVRLGGSATTFENRYRHKDGSYRWLVWNSTPDPAPGVIYAVARDLTAQKAAEEERARLHRELEQSLAEIKTLQEILAICSYCGKIRDDEDYWHTVESYISQHTESQFSHGICPSCMTDLVEPLLDDDAGLGVSVRTVYKWLRRYRREGEAGLQDRSSRPRRILRQTPQSVVRRIIGLRCRRWASTRIARHLGLAVSTVGAVLRRVGLNRLSRLERRRPTIRYEMKRPGQLLHLDTKKLGRIQGVGHRIHGDRRRRARGVGWEFLHICIDDATRLVYQEMLPDEKGETATGFLERAAAWFRGHGVPVERVMTDNGSCYRSRRFRRAVKQIGAKHVRTRPYQPQTNGKAERYIQTALREWAYAHAYPDSRARSAALRPFTLYYN